MATPAPAPAHALHQDQRPKRVLFLPINAAGHIHASLAIADRLREDHGFQSVFLLVGPPLSRSITNHGHQLIELPESSPYEDYEIEQDEDTSKPVDEALKQSQGKKRVSFLGASLWPQIVARHAHLFRAAPIEGFKATFHVIAKHNNASLMANSEALEREVERLQPDLIICDVYMPLPVVLRHERARPWVRLHSGNPIGVTRASKLNGDQVTIRQTSRLLTKAERERLRREQPQRWRELVAEWRQIGRELTSFMAYNIESMRAFYRARGCLPTGELAVDSPHLNIYMFPKALDYDQEDDLIEYPPRWFGCDSLIRSCSGSSETTEAKFWAKLLDERLASNPKLQVIYFSLGSIASGNLQLMQKYVDILAADEAADRLYVVSKGVNGDRFQLSARNMIGANYLPQTIILQRAHLALAHGGNNTLIECFYHAVPMVVLPNFGDQFDNGQRLEDLQLGRALNLFDCKRDQLLQTIDSLLADELLRAKVEAIGRQMRTRDDLAKLSQTLRRLIERGRLDEKEAHNQTTGHL